MYTVILLDDEPMAIKACQHALAWADFGMTVIESFNQPVHALEWLQTHDVDLAFVDLRMPGMDGFQFIEAARRLRPFMQFVILSGFDDFSYVRQAFRLQAFDYCLKPIHSRENLILLPQLEAALAEQRLTKDRVYFDDAPITPTPDPHPFPFLSHFATDERFYLIHVHAQRLQSDPSIASTQTPAYWRVRWLEALGGAHIVQAPQHLHIFVPVDTNEANLSVAELVDRIAADGADLITYASDPIPRAALASVWRNWRTQTGITRRGIHAVSLLRANTVSAAPLIDQALTYLHAHYQEAITLQDLAQALHINYTYCSELIKRHTDMTFSAYLNHLRLTHAADRLRTTQDSIQSIALEVGYNSEQYFARSFHQAYGMSASSYRRQRGQT